MSSLSSLTSSGNIRLDNIDSSATVTDPLAVNNATIGTNITMTSYGGMKLYPKVPDSDIVVSGNNVIITIPSWATKVTVLGRQISWGATSYQPIWKLGSSTGTNPWTAAVGVCRQSSTTSSILNASGLSGIPAWSVAMLSVTMNVVATFYLMGLESNKQTWFMTASANVASGVTNGASSDGYIVGPTSEIADRIQFTATTTPSFSSGLVKAIFE